MTEKKYLVVGGEVVSATDGQTHYVSSFHLCALYRVKKEDCILVDYPGSSPDFSGCAALHGVVLSKLLKLTLRADGDYLLPQEKNK